MGDLMDFREPNQVNWQGVRPGHNGVQVLISGIRLAIGAVGVYQVPAGNTLFLTCATLGVGNQIASALNLSIYNAVPAIVQSLMGGYQAPGHNFAPAVANYWPPIEIPASFWLYVNESGLCALTYLFHGWVE